MLLQATPYPADTATVRVTSTSVNTVWPWQEVRGYFPYFPWLANVDLTGLYLDNGLVDSQQLLRLGVVARVVEVQELPPVIKQFVSIMFC